MAMPKGHKSEHGYATVSIDHGGMDYRTIAEKMSDEGHRMNHATARNVFLRAMRKIAAPVCAVHGVNSDSEIDRTARDPRFQEGMIEIMSDMYNDSLVDV